MRRALFAWCGLFLGAWLVALAVRLPAAVALGMSRGPSAALLADRGGSLWHGHAATRPPLPPAQLQWRLSPAPSWRGCLSGNGQISRTGGAGRPGSAALGGTVRFELCPLADTVTMVAADLQVPARDWPAMLGLAIVQLSGTVHVTAQRLGMTSGGLHGAARAEWRDAAVELGQRIGLGSVEIRLNAVDGVTTIDASNEAGAAPAAAPADRAAQAGLAIRVTVDATGRYRLTGHLDPKGDPALQETLSMAGDRGPDGRIVLRATGTLPPLDLSARGR